MGESIVMFKRIELVSEDVKSVTNAQKAQILMNALPYIKKYSNKIVVVKYGGNAMINEDLRKSVMGDIVLLNLIGVKVVLVHRTSKRRSINWAWNRNSSTACASPTQKR